MATRTYRPRTRVEDTPEPPGSFPTGKTRNKRTMFRVDEHDGEEQPRKEEEEKKYLSPPKGREMDSGNDPDSDPGSSDDDNDRDNKHNSWKGTKWNPLVQDTERLNLVSEKKKPKIPTPQKMNGDNTWSKAATFDNWVLEVLDWLVIYEVNPHDPNQPEAITYTSGYLEGVAKEFLRI